MTGPANAAGERCTEIDGWQAVWRLEQHSIRMMLVHNVSDALTLMAATTPAVAPDLAHMREQFPRLTRLWDAVRHEYWTEFITPQQSAREGRSHVKTGKVSR
ncbi:hypothetical protein BJY24_005847 [Nocardia transvalensis]|uniref:Uncharacterized protein n=1 Tax=Nocardia transvalensis TaxID=37333 RepID=A0A7W9ULP5_9NOCA|nr:hypothetical protein [Nocardia transvalensis]MBB5916935.1 hypothetical protein [Nocardia transvalensis]